MRTGDPARRQGDNPHPGLTWFWFLNDECRDETMDRMLDAFAAAGSTVVLHPRAGLELPYGGDDWFAMIERTVERCEQLGLTVWLYDEDPYPSGCAGGRITCEHPEYEARAIERFTVGPDVEEGGLFTFPVGNLLWCGLVDEGTGAVEDLTARVGMVRLHWQEIGTGDSRWYYPATPLYYCERSEAYGLEYALRAPARRPGQVLQAFVARPCGGESVWGGLPDPLNPDVTRLFLRLTHERYQETVGRHFGGRITSIFADEPKYFGQFPWTSGLFESFERRFGYDLHPHLWRLFGTNEDPLSMRCRLHYRQWCGERFCEAWVEPVADWCRQHDLWLVGHISPEDDPVEQAACITNLFPVFPHFDLPGIDLIIPAVGDRQHPLINLGVLSATSAAQQHDKPGVMSESLGCSGAEATVETATRVLRWQAVMGVNTPVVHAAFNSTAGLRVKDAPPDWGPQSPHWDGMCRLSGELAEHQAVTWQATQIAPVALLWPIRTFNVLPFTAYSNESPWRDRLVDVVRCALDRQVGLHILDEADLWRSEMQAGSLTVGRATYTHVVVPPALILHRQTFAVLKAAEAAGIDIRFVEPFPAWQEDDDGVTPADPSDFRCLDAADALTGLPRLAEVEPGGTDVRCTVWEKDGTRTLLAMNLNAAARRLQVGSQSHTLEPGRVYHLPWHAGG